MFTNRGPLATPLNERLSRLSYLSCHDRQLLSSLAFEREWKKQPKMFSDKGFADGANVARSSGSAVVMIVVIVTAVTGVGKNHAANNVVQRTSVTENPQKQDLTKGIVSVPIDDASRNIPLWIKVPPENLPHAKSSPRCILRRIWQENAANHNLKPE